MNVTEGGFKDRQLHIEDYLQMVSAEQKEYAEVSAHQRIAENNYIITDFQTDKLMEKILSNDNLNQAYKKVKSNKGAGGVDGMNVDELLSFLRDNGTQLKQQLMIGKYKPNPVRRVEIPKETNSRNNEIPVMISPFKMGMLFTKPMVLRARFFKLKMPIAVMLPNKVDAVAAIRAIVTVFINAFINE